MHGFMWIPANNYVILSADASYQLKQFQGGGRDTALGEGKSSVRKRKVGRYWQIEAVIHRLICHLWFHLCGIIYIPVNLLGSHLLGNIQVLLHNRSCLCQKSFTHF